ncbi:hypothetical protein GDO78_021022 [Eleutherodactylus coqui]|uniref:Uncharacterized protein n=1 Tax=Eleutherodactylus coqui TaxID=57060 RepID=A0A8J6BAV9_ELECQ|nr:hypothetical protein GDO78_021022 [Eleutherodactylus coqui]
MREPRMRRSEFHRCDARRFSLKIVSHSRVKVVEYDTWLSFLTRYLSYLCVGSHTWMMFFMVIRSVLSFSVKQLEKGSGPEPSSYLEYVILRV